MRSRVPLSLAAFGERKTLIEWTQDPRCQISLRELRSRIEKGWESEPAISTPSTMRPSRARNSIEAFGEEKTVAEWSRDPRAAVSALTIAARVQRGWEHEEAITTPVHGKVRPVRAVTPRPPHTRRPRMGLSNEPITDLGTEEVRKRLALGAELWFAGSSGDRVSLVERETTTLVGFHVLKTLLETGKIEVECKIGTVIQYGLAVKEPVS